MRISSISNFETSNPVVLMALSDALALIDGNEHPAILLGGDTVSGLEVRSILQSQGFEVLCGADLMNADDEPILVVMNEFLAQPQNRARFNRMRDLLPLAPVLTVFDPDGSRSRRLVAHS